MLTGLPWALAGEHLAHSSYSRKYLFKVSFFFFFLLKFGGMGQQYHVPILISQTKVDMISIGMAKGIIKTGIQFFKNKFQSVHYY